MFETSRTGSPKWRNSQIAALLAVDRDLGARVGEMDHSRGVGERGGDVRVRLKKGGIGSGNGGGWVLGGDG